MERSEVVAYLIMEASTDPVRPQNLQVFDKNGLFYLKFLATLQEFNMLNRNRRVYESQAMMMSLRAPHILELMANRSWCGEAGHPLTDDVKRILTIDPKLISHRVNSINLIGNLLKGEVETLDDKDGYGSRMTRYILQGMEPAFSLRALAKLVKRGDGTELVNSMAHIVGYDWVILPSHVKAYRDKSKPIEKIIKSIQLDGNSVQECCLSPVHEAAIMDYVKMESKNVKVVSNVYGVATENMELSNDGKYTIMRENNRTFVTKIEDRIRHDVGSYMRNL